MDFDKIGRGFRAYLDRPDVVATLVMSVAAIVIVSLLLHYLLSARRRIARHLRRLFRRFADVNRLTRGESALLWNVAQHGQLEDPSLIFVKRGLFENAVPELGLDAALADSVRRKIYGP